MYYQVDEEKKKHSYKTTIVITMPLIKKRNCPECGGEMEAKLINLSYKREGVDLEVEVIGIPANVCEKCFYRIIPGKVAKYKEEE